MNTTAEVLVAVNLATVAVGVGGGGAFVGFLLARIHLLPHTVQGLHLLLLQTQSNTDCYLGRDGIFMLNRIKINMVTIQKSCPK